jgi:predicted TIM-barrel fold metal-dependent hydrolase
MERHARLRFVFLEAGGGWAPYWLYRLDEQVHGFGGFCPQMRLRPSEYFARQCWVSFEVDEPTLPALVPFVGEDRIVWGSDYPHHDATFPGALKELREVIAPLPQATQAKILGANAAALYRLS